MLEAETTDNVIYWNRMDAWVPRPGAVTPTATDPDDDPPAATGGGGGGRGAGPGGGRGAGPGGGAGFGGGQGRGQQGPPLVPIFKVMEPTTMRLRMMP